MDAPTCRLCGKQHWARVGCRFLPASEDQSDEIVRLKRELADANRKVVALQAEVTALLSNAASNKPAQQSNGESNAPQLESNKALESNGDGTFDKQAYQREYMRLRRAKAKQ